EKNILNRTVDSDFRDLRAGWGPISNMRTINSICDNDQKFQEAILSLRVLDTDLTNCERIEALVSLMDPNDTGCIESLKFKKMIRNLVDIVALESIDKEGLINEWERHLLNHVHIPADSSVNIQIEKDEIVNGLLCIQK
ncbi:unnamed protein product, partial [Didymodactylos carnosus]